MPGLELSGQISPTPWGLSFPIWSRSCSDCKLAPLPDFTQCFKPRLSSWTQGGGPGTSYFTGRNIGLRGRGTARRPLSSSRRTLHGLGWERKLPSLQGLWGACAPCGLKVGVPGTQEGLEDPRSGWTAPCRCSITPRSTAGSSAPGSSRGGEGGASEVHPAWGAVRKHPSDLPRKQK